MYTFIDWILFILLALCVGYLLFYAIASKFYRPQNFPKHVSSVVFLYSSLHTRKTG